MAAWLEKWSAKCKSLSALHLALGFFLVVGFLVLSAQKGTEEVVVKRTEAAPAQEQVLEETEPPVVPEEPGEIFVHVSGQVNSPGVVCLPSGSRVYEAVEQAGGMTQDGDLESVNLAEVVLDQQKIVVGSVKESLMAASNTSQRVENSVVPSPESQGKININTASKDLLESLPGIGPVIAENIIVYRQTKGSFQTIEDIKNVPRIGDATFANIKGLIGVR